MFQGGPNIFEMLVQIFPQYLDRGIDFRGVQIFCDISPVRCLYSIFNGLFIGRPFLSPLPSSYGVCFRPVLIVDY
jgi:hypothetical protein